MLHVHTYFLRLKTKCLCEFTPEEETINGLVCINIYITQEKANVPGFFLRECVHVGK